MLGSFTLALAVTGFAQTGGDDVQPHIYGGTETDRCGWPSAVYLQHGGGACTGVLVHPLIVMTAAHCVEEGDPSSVRFGENAQTAQALVQTAYCRQAPGWTGATGTGQDYGYCKLAAPVTSVPIVPVAEGCEQGAIGPGARIMHVGFGTDENGDTGRKKMLESVVTSVGGGELLSGQLGETICNGDSGGPTFVYLDPELGGDGTWRVAAVHSWAEGADPVNPNCTGTAGSVLASQAIDWIEQDSGIDITPCTDDGVWNPTAHCGGVPTHPWDAGGTYTTACTSPEIVEYASVCGPGLDSTPDDTAPAVAFITPTLEQQFASDGEVVDVDIELSASDAGWGVETVELTITSVTHAQEQVEVRNEWQSWSFSAALPSGSYEVSAVATDYAGNRSAPVTVCFGVDEPGCGVDPGETSDTDDDEGGGTGDDPDAEETTGASPDPDEPDGDDDSDEEPEADTDDAGADETSTPSGCGCRTRDEAPPPGFWVLALLGVGRRRDRTGSRPVTRTTRDRTASSR